MILTDYVEISISKKNIQHFSLYYKDIKLKDIIKVHPEKLQKGSNIFIDVSCDVCGLKRNIKYQSYYKNINSCDEYKIYTCDKCSHIKIKSFNRKKWGVDYFSQTEEYTNKFKNTMIERYGVEYALQSKELKDRAKKTNLNKFGVENPFMNNNMIKSKFKEKWGVDHPSKSKDIVDKIKETKLINDTSLSSQRIREKIKETNIKIYGKKTPLESDIIRDNIISNDINYIKYIGSSTSMFNCDKGHLFYIDSSNYHNRKRSNIPLCTVCNPIGNSQSIKEKELFNYIESIYSGEIIKSYRDGLEIDIYLPHLKLGFEFNGLYWHSDEWKDKKYHLDKTNYFKERGIRIIHIWEDDWALKSNTVESQIRNWIGSTEKRIFARKCEVKLIDCSKICNRFLNENHIQGSVNSVLKLGLYHNGELVSLMTFDHFEGRKKMQEGGWNLSRFCNKLDTNVVGGASKLLKHFIKNYNPKRIISYADKDWSEGSLYEKIGFTRIHETKPDYKYILNEIRVHKSRFRKSRLNTELSESQEMRKSHIKKIWDCGKIKFEIKFNRE
jgi:hypothetical protein